MELKQAGEIQITKDRETNSTNQCPTNGYTPNKNYIPLCLGSIGVVIGLGLFFYKQSNKPEKMNREIMLGKEKPSEQIPLKTPEKQKEIDPFEIN